MRLGFIGSLQLTASSSALRSVEECVQSLAMTKHHIGTCTLQYYLLPVNPHAYWKVRFSVGSCCRCYHLMSEERSEVWFNVWTRWDLPIGQPYADTTS